MSIYYNSSNKSFKETDKSSRSIPKYASTTYILRSNIYHGSPQYDSRNYRLSSRRISIQLIPNHLSPHGIDQSQWSSPGSLVQSWLTQDAPIGLDQIAAKPPCEFRRQTTKQACNLSVKSGDRNMQASKRIKRTANYSRTISKRVPTLERLDRPIPLSRVYGYGWRSNALSGLLFRGVPFRTEFQRSRMENSSPGSMDWLDTHSAQIQPSFNCQQFPFFNSTMDRLSSSGLKTSGSMRTSHSGRLAKALFLSTGPSRSAPQKRLQKVTLPIIMAIDISRTHTPDDQLSTLDWAKKECRSAKMKDARLVKRMIHILDAFLTRPNMTIPGVHNDWGKTKATYRFFQNKRVTFDNIARPHQTATCHRISGVPRILAIQDTTVLNYTHLRETEGLGRVNKSTDSTRGIILHSTMAMTPDKVPLGLLDQQVWIRPLETEDKRHRRKKPIEEKESFKWLKSLDACIRAGNCSPLTHIINIGDRESDVYELFMMSKKLPAKVDLLVRASWDRRMDHPQYSLWSYMDSQPVVDTFEIQVPRKKKKKARTASVELRFSHVTLRPPKHKENKWPPIDLCCVCLSEPDPPDEEEQIVWRLLTTLNVDTIDQATTCVRYYSARYTIETFHKVLKSGCLVEKLQLEKASRLIRAIALLSIVAYRILYLTMVGRINQDIPCTAILEDYEWKSLYCFVNKTRTPPEKPPTIGEVTKMIARIGGFLNRKSDGHPGPMVLWRGLRNLSFISNSWLIFGPETIQRMSPKPPWVFLN